MEKKIAEYLSTEREIRTIMFEEGDRFMYDLSQLPQVIKRWKTYREAKEAEEQQKIEKLRKDKRNRIANIEDLEKILSSEKGGKAKILEAAKVKEEPEVDEDKASIEEALDIGITTKIRLDSINLAIDYAYQLSEEVSKKVYAPICAKLFDIIFLT